MARGYVDLMPPSNYSPERGVICESLSVDSEDRKTGACYTPEGPSVMLTARHISETAASDLREKLTARGHTGAFTMATGVSCDPGLRKCRFTPESVGAGQPAPLHTSALFWTDVPQ